MFHQFFPDETFQFPFHKRCESNGRCLEEQASIHEQAFLSPLTSNYDVGTMAPLFRVFKPASLGSRNDRPCSPYTCQKTRKRNVQVTRKPTVAMLDFREFYPKEIEVKITDRCVLVHGRHEDESGFFEKTRSVPLLNPGHKPHLVSRYINGFVVIELTSNPETSDKGATGRDSAVTEKKEETSDSEKVNREEKLAVSESATEEERKAYEYVRRNVRNLQSTFASIFGIPMFPECDCENRKEEEKGEIREKNEGKGATTSHEILDEDRGKKAEGENATTAAAADDRTSGLEANSPCDSQTGGDGEQTCLFLKYEPPSNSFLKYEPLIDDDGSIHAIREPEGRKHALDSGADETDIDDKVTVRPDFKLDFDMSKFKPDDIRLLFSDGHVVVSGEREIQNDNYRGVEKWSRRILLPDDVDESKLKSVISKEGMMTIWAPFRSATEKRQWSDIPIVFQE